MLQVWGCNRDHGEIPTVVTSYDGRQLTLHVQVDVSQGCRFHYIFWPNVDFARSRIEGSAYHVPMPNDPLPPVCLMATRTH